MSRNSTVLLDWNAKKKMKMRIKPARDFGLPGGLSEILWPYELFAIFPEDEEELAQQLFAPL